MTRPLRMAQISCSDLVTPRARAPQGAELELLCQIIPIMADPPAGWPPGRNRGGEAGNLTSPPHTAWGQKHPYHAEARLRLHGVSTRRFEQATGKIKLAGFRCASLDVDVWLWRDPGWAPLPVGVPPMLHVCPKFRVPTFLVGAVCRVA